MADYDLGIDVGTNATRMAVKRAGAAAPEIWRFPSGTLYEPTVVYAGRAGRLVGEAALSAVGDDVADATATEFACSIGLGESVLLGRQAWQPERLVAMVVADAIGRVTEQEGAAPRTIVLACPPYWIGSRLAKLQAALVEIGLAQVRLTGSVQAAALAHVALGSVAKGQTVGVFVIGASVFTAGVLGVTDEGKVRVRSLVGDDQRGGNQIDEALASYVRASAPGRVSTDPVSLREASRVAKEQLSDALDAQVAVSLDGDGDTASHLVVISRSQFDTVAADVIDSCIAALKELVYAARANGDEVTEVVVAGGSVKIPRITAELTRLGLHVVAGVDPTCTIAIGAALTAEDVARASGAVVTPSPRPADVATAAVVAAPIVVPEAIVVPEVVHEPVAVQVPLSVVVPVPEPVVPEPVPPEPVVSEPVVSEPVVSEPVVSEPVRPEPADVAVPVVVAPPPVITPEAPTSVHRPTVPPALDRQESGPTPIEDVPTRRGRRGLIAGAIAVVVVAIGGFAIVNSRRDGSSTSTAPRTTVTATAATVTTEPTVTTDGTAATEPPVTAEAATTAATKARIATANGVGAAATDMVEIPAATYPIGSPKPDLLAESKRRDAEVTAFFIDQHEVTNAEYKNFVDATGAAAPLAGWNASGPSEAKLDHPVRGITYEWADAYCTSLGKRLPTETEWEVAAAGKDGQKFAWGNDIGAVELPAKDTYAVMSVAANKSAFGVFDLTGSVWEWVSNPYDTNKVPAGQHLLRGGQNGYIRNNWSRLPVDEAASNAVLAAGMRCAATTVSSDIKAGQFGTYRKPPVPVPPQLRTPAGYKFYDDFSGSRLDWIEVTLPNVRFGYHPNKFFHLETKAANQTVVASCPCSTPAGNVAISATAEVEPTLTLPDGSFAWGIVVRAAEASAPSYVPSDFVALVVNQRQQTWSAYVHHPDGSKTVIGGAQFNGLESDSVSVEMHDLGGKIEFYINGTYRGESPPTAKLPTGNHAGFILSSDANSTKVHIHFSNFGIRNL